MTSDNRLQKKNTAKKTNRSPIYLRVMSVRSDVKHLTNNCQLVSAATIFQPASKTAASAAVHNIQSRLLTQTGVLTPTIYAHIQQTCVPRQFEFISKPVWTDRIYIDYVVSSFLHEIQRERYRERETRTHR